MNTLKSQLLSFPSCRVASLQRSSTLASKLHDDTGRKSWLKSLFTFALLVFVAGAFALSAAQAQTTGTLTNDFTIVVLPDPQYYSQNYPATFAAQTNWIVNNRSALNIQFVLGVGDLVNEGGSSTQWANANTAISALDSAGIPYAMAIGNKDYDYPYAHPFNRSAVNFNTYFGNPRYSNYPWYGGHDPSGGNENSYATVTIQGKEFLFLVLELFPRDSELTWARSVMAQHPGAEVIFVTHGFLNYTDVRLGPCNSLSTVETGLPNDNDGEKLWDNFVKHYGNLSLVLSGHVINSGGATGRRQDLAVNGNIVTQLLANYQTLSSGGDGYLRILKFRPSVNTIEVTTYSPTDPAFPYLTDTANQFTVTWHSVESPIGPSTTVQGRVFSNVASCTSSTYEVGANVSLLENGVPIYSDVTNASGYFIFSTVAAPKNYSLIVTNASGAYAERTLTAGKGFPPYLMIQLKSGDATISGTVSGEGSPLAQAVVSYHEGSTFSGGTGSYALSHVAAGTYDVTAVAPGFLPSTQSVTVSAGGSATVDFNLSRPGPHTTTISINNIPADAAFNGSFTPTFDYVGDGTTSVTSSTSTCTVSGSTVNFVAPGECTLTAHATAGTQYAAVDGTQQSFTISQAQTTITIDNIPVAAVYGGSFTPSLSYSGDGTTSVTSSTTTCTVSGTAVNFTGAGTCTLTAHATAGTNYFGTDGTPQSFTIAKATPTIAINNIPTSALVGGNFTPAYSYNGDGTPSVTSNTSTCTVSGSTVSFAVAGTCTLVAHASAGPNYNAVNGPLQSFTITQPLPGTISGTVTNSSGKGISKATVSFGTRSTQTNKTGKYSFTSVPPGPYSVTASATGYRPQTLSVSVASGATSTLNFVLSTTTSGTITGQVKSSAGTPISGALVSYSGGSALSDAFGNYTLANVAAATYSVSASAAGYSNVTQSVSVVAGSTTVANFSLAASSNTTGAIQGKVTLSGKPVVGTPVTIKGGSQTISTSTLSDGTYASGWIPTGPYTVTVTTQQKAATVTANTVTTVNFNFKK